MAEEFKPEEQKGAEKGMFVSDCAVALWPGIRYKILAVPLPHTFASQSKE